MKKNTAGQKWRVYAWHRNTGVPATGIAATITATINKDFAGEVATDYVNPTEVGSGYYEFVLTQAETNAYQLSLKPATTTNGVQVRAIPETLATETTNAVDPLTTQMTESYAADGVAPTLAQAIFLIQQSLHEFAISGTTRTVRKLDGIATAAVFTLDDADAPTSTTRAS